MKIKAASYLAFSLVTSSVAHAQSFNCSFARTPDEVLICQDSHLSELDERMATQYAQVRNSLPPPARHSLEAEQAEWLRTRHQCGRDGGCIAASYQQRIRELQAYQ
jgi:uncharacterized protein